MFTFAATISGEVFEELEQLFKADVRDGSVDQFHLARVKRMADALLQADPSEGYVALSALAALKWDVTGAQSHIDAALRCDRSVANLCNAVTTFEFLNRSDLAKPFALAAGVAAGADDKVVQTSVTSLLTGGFISEAAQLSAVFSRSNPEAELPFDPIQISETLEELQVSESHVIEVIGLARQVLTDRKLRTREFGIYAERDPDGTLGIGYEVGFVGTLEDEFDLEACLSDKLGDLVGWNPSKVTAHMKYVSPAYVSSSD